MARIAGVNVPSNKRLEISLEIHLWYRTQNLPKDICKSVKIDPNKRVNELNEDETIIKIREFIDKNFLVEGDLRREINKNKKINRPWLLQRFET